MQRYEGVGVLFMLTFPPSYYFFVIVVDSDIASIYLLLCIYLSNTTLDLR